MSGGVYIIDRRSVEAQELLGDNWVGYRKNKKSSRPRKAKGPRQESQKQDAKLDVGFFYETTPEVDTLIQPREVKRKIPLTDVAPKNNVSHPTPQPEQSQQNHRYQQQQQKPKEPAAPVDQDAVYEYLTEDYSFLSKPEWVLYNKDDRPSIPATKRGVYDTEFSVVAADSYDRFLYMKEREMLDPVVLDLASEFCPGGGWRKAGTGQEESLCRRSTLGIVLEKARDQSKNERFRSVYPIKPHSGIYVPDVVVWANRHGDAYKKKGVWLSHVIVVPAVRKPQVVNQYMSLEDASVMKDKMRTIFRIASHKGHDSIMLGAFGCGFFACPPRHVAVLFRDVLREPEFAGVFKHLSWAIFGNSDNSKYLREVFSDVLIAKDTVAPTDQASIDATVKPGKNNHGYTTINNRAR